MLEILRNIRAGAWYLSIFVSAVVTIALCVVGIAYLLDWYMYPTAITLGIILLLVICETVGKFVRSP